MSKIAWLFDTPLDVWRSERIPYLNNSEWYHFHLDIRETCYNYEMSYIYPKSLAIPFL